MSTELANKNVISIIGDLLLTSPDIEFVLFNGKQAVDKFLAIEDIVPFLLQYQQHIFENPDIYDPRIVFKWCKLVFSLPVIIASKEFLPNSNVEDAIEEFLLNLVISDWFIKLIFDPLIEEIFIPMNLQFKVNKAAKKMFLGGCLEVEPKIEISRMINGRKIPTGFALDTFEFGSLNQFYEDSNLSFQDDLSKEVFQRIMYRVIQHFSKGVVEYFMVTDGNILILFHLKKISDDMKEIPIEYRLIRTTDYYYSSNDCWAFILLD